MMMDNDAIEFLLRFLETDSVSPLEGGDPAGTRRAQEMFAEFTRDRGFEVSWETADVTALLADPHTPVLVREHAGAEGWLSDQPVVAASIGDADAEKTVVINFHVDTVSPHLPVEFRDGVIHARGAVDDKGAGIAVVCGVAYAYRQNPDLAGKVRTVILSVPGEEGGAMGCYGTKPALAKRDKASLLVFAEPTGLLVHDTSFATMTLEVTMDAPDSTDDFPYENANATLVLAAVATDLASGLKDLVENRDIKCCVAGLHTGLQHNRVYGSGRLLVNFAYCDTRYAQVVHERVEEILAASVERVKAEYGPSRFAREWAADLGDALHWRWLKQGLPSLRNRSSEYEALLAECGLERLAGDQLDEAFTSDAIWGQDAADYTVVCGPGGLDSHGAHTDGEYVAVSELDEYARRIALLVTKVADSG
ncbi:MULTISPECIES: M20 family metallopeptidase [unclassified Streptomyces]|uniref:M20 family metallopeptidase n=1 Tax=unclassified Streptomyces TaxID=2593676 RepID=UPI002E29D212|nr:M20/M25/M40 family metallo-hydrolase [Streptomyces sp. NBC_01439]